VNPRVLILDGNPGRHARFDKMLPQAARSHAYTADQAVASLEESPAFDVVFLDHDLPKSAELLNVSDLGTGLDVAVYIAKELSMAKKPGLVWIHSHNPEGRLKMARVLRSAGLVTTIQRFRFV
jgi:CheY-like chemotaxis protein